MYRNEHNSNVNENNYYRYLKDVVKDSYFIASYQRGYRWDTENVEELLNDIYEGKLIENNVSDDEKLFSGQKLIYKINTAMGNNGSASYCLQPLVVKKIGERYSVIDGQQRLTTLFIIMKVLSQISEIKFPEGFSIEYQSRKCSKDFLEQLCENSKPDNIDTEYIMQTYNCAKKWFLDKNKEFCNYLESENSADMSKMNSALAEHMHTVLLDETRFIWDEIDSVSPEKEQKIFADRNTGKLDLTDSELIKSLFMNPEYYGERRTDISDRQILISELWDIYENDLHKSDFWAFLPLSLEYKELYAKKTRIDAIFWLLAQKEKLEIRTEENGLFKAIQEWISDKRKIERVKQPGNNKIDPMATVMHQCWREVCNLIDGIKELYDNNEIYNLLSLYKIASTDSKAVLDLYIKALGESKSQRAAKIKEGIRSLLFSDDVAKTIKSVRYPNPKIKNILIAHNISILNTTKPIERFSFKFFEKGSDETYDWDREHIYATNESYIEDASMEEKKDVLTLFSNKNSYKEYINYLYNLDNEKFISSDGEKFSGIDALERKYQPRDSKDTFIKWCFEKSNARYDQDFDIWRSLKLKEVSDDFLRRIDIMYEIEGILREKDSKLQETKLETFLQNTDYDDGKKWIFLGVDYLFWDKNISEEFLKIKQTMKKPSTISWHNYMINIPDPGKFWDAEEDDLTNQSNFRRNFYRDILDEVYDNTGIASQNVTMENHGLRKKQIVNPQNKDLLLSFLTGTKCRIEEKIQEFFKKGEHIDSSNTIKGIMDDYKTFADLVNDNSLGNMMLLPLKINRDGKYRAANFDGKREVITQMGNAYFLPVASVNVLLGKYNKLGSGVRQWLMEERRAYLKDMIETMKEYYN